jgi:hypothetical protein
VGTWSRRTWHREGNGRGCGQEGVGAVEESEASPDRRICRGEGTLVRAAEAVCHGWKMGIRCRRMAATGVLLQVATAAP